MPNYITITVEAISIESCTAIAAACIGAISIRAELVTLIQTFCTLIHIWKGQGHVNDSSHSTASMLASA